MPSVTWPFILVGVKPSVTFQISTYSKPNRSPSISWCHQLSLICYFKRRHMLSISSINLIYVIYNPSTSNIYQIDTQTHNRYQLNIKPFQLICNFRYSNWQFTPLKLYHSSISLICVICKLHRYRTHIKLVHNTVLTTLSSRHTSYQILLISNISDWYTAQKNLLNWTD